MAMEGSKLVNYFPRTIRCFSLKKIIKSIKLFWDVQVLGNSYLQFKIEKYARFKLFSEFIWF